MEVIDRVAPSENNEENLEELHKLFNEQGYSDYIVVFLVGTTRIMGSYVKKLLT